MIAECKRRDQKIECLPPLGSTRQGALRGGVSERPCHALETARDLVHALTETPRRDTRGLDRFFDPASCVVTLKRAPQQEWT